LKFLNATTVASGASPALFLGSGLPGCTQNSSPNPQNIYIDSLDTLWVPDSICNRVLGFYNASSKAQAANADVVVGQPDFVSSSAACNSTGMSNPRAAFHDVASSILLVTDLSYFRILSYSTIGIVNGPVATGVVGQPDFTTCTVRTTSPTTILPYGIQYDAASGVRLLVASTGENRVVRLDCPLGFPAGPSFSSSISQSLGITPSNTDSASVSLSQTPSQTGSKTGTATNSRTQSGTTSVTGTGTYLCGNQIVEPSEQCDPGTGNFGDALTCCNHNCRWKQKGEVCDKAVNVCTRPPRCSGRRTNPGVCLPGKYKKVGATCTLPGSTKPMNCDGSGNCIIKT